MRVLSRRINDEFGWHHIEFVTVAGHRDADDGVVAAVIDEVGHLGLVVEADAWFVVKAASHTPLEQGPAGADDLNGTGTGFLPGAAEPNAVLGGHVHVERALADHVVDDPGEEPLQFDAARREQMMQVPALCRSGPTLAAGVGRILFQDDDLLEGPR